MTYKPISVFDDPVAARWGHVMGGPYEEDEDDRRERVAAERSKERLERHWAERGLSRPLHQTPAEQQAFLDELRVGARGA